MKEAGAAEAGGHTGGGGGPACLAVGLGQELADDARSLARDNESQKKKAGQDSQYHTLVRQLAVHTSPDIHWP